MTAVVANQPPRALYAGAMLGVALLATACAWFVAGALADDSSSAVAAAGVVFGASIVGLLPAVTGSARHFGVVVLAASIARLLIVLVAGVLLTEFAGHPKRPIWIGAASGAGLALVAESALAIFVIASMDRSRAGRGAIGRPAQESGASC